MNLECSQEIALPQMRPSALERRFVGLIVAIPCWAMLLVGAMLHPNVCGYGTHEQLGLPPCTFLARTGWPCPSCGLTTSVSLMAHGQIAAAFSAQPFGVLLAMAAAFFALGGTWQAVTGRNVIRKLGHPLVWVFLALAGLLGGWAWNICSGIASGQLPLR